MAWKIKSVTLKNFKSFQKTQTIDFPDSGLVLIKGISGSGKTSIVTAIAYALGICRVPSTKLKNFFTEDDMQVSLTLVDGDREITIRRGSTTSITIDGDTKSGATAVEEQLQKIFPFDRQTFGAMVYRPQRSKGLFLSMTDSAKKEFLSGLLNLNVIETAIEISKERQTSLVNESILAQNEINGQVKELSELLVVDEAVFSARKAELESLNIQLGTLKTEIQNAESERNQKITSLDTHLAQLDAAKQVEQEKFERAAKETLSQIENEPAKPSTEDLESLVQKLTKEIQTYRLKEISLLGQVQENTTLIQRNLHNCEQWDKEYAERNSLEEKASKLADKLCPTCDQGWAAGVESKEAKRVLDRIKYLDTIPDQIKNALAQSEVAKKNLIALESDLSVIAQERDSNNLSISIYEKEKSDRLANYRLEHAGWLAKRDSVILEQKNILLEIQQRYSSQKQKITAEQNAAYAEFQEKEGPLRMSVKLLQKDIEHKQNQLSADLGANQVKKERSEKLKKFVSLGQAEVLEIQKEIDLEKDFQQLMGREGFLGSIFDEILQEVNVQVNEKVAHFPNINSFVFGLRTDSVTKKGVAKKDIVSYLIRDGVELPIDTLSGGQATSLDLIVDFAISDIISRRTGILPGWMILDEAFEGHDASIKESCLEFLVDNASEKQIIVIDHSSETKEMFTQCIEVENKEGVSLINEAYSSSI
jgi:DNA repair exonuclease SbcCD ATPase subunit